MELSFTTRPMMRSLQDTDLSDIVVFTITAPPYWDEVRSNVLIVPVDVEPNADQVRRIVNRLASSSSAEETLVERAQQALDTNTTFMSIATPTQAQVLAQVRALTRENSALIRLLLRQLDSAE